MTSSGSMPETSSPTAMTSPRVRPLRSSIAGGRTSPESSVVSTRPISPTRTRGPYGLSVLLIDPLDLARLRRDLEHPCRWHRHQCCRDHVERFGLTLIGRRLEASRPHQLLRLRLGRLGPARSATVDDLDVSDVLVE